MKKQSKYEVPHLLCVYVCVCMMYIYIYVCVITICYVFFRVCKEADIKEEFDLAIENGFGIWNGTAIYWGIVSKVI